MKVFISHAAGEAALARSVAKRLESAGYKAWSDDEIAAGDNWALKIGKELEKSDAMVLLISSETFKSESVQSELDYALGSKRFAGKVIPVLVEEAADMPWILRTFQWVKGEGGDEKEIGKRVIDALQAAKS